MTIPQLEEMLEQWVRSVGRGCSEADVAALAQAIALEKIAKAINERQV